MYAKNTAQQHRERFTFIAGVLSLGFAAIIIQAFNNQVLMKDIYAEQAKKYIHEQRLHLATRADILDRHGEPLAISNPRSVIVLEPKNFLDGLTIRAEQQYKSCLDKLTAKGESALVDMVGCQDFPVGAEQNEALKSAFVVREEQRRWQQLVNYLNDYRVYPTTVKRFQDEVRDIAQRGKNQGRNYFVLNRDVRDDVAHDLMKMGFIGLRQENGFDRYYPQKELFAQIVGYTEKMISMPSVDKVVSHEGEKFFAEGQGIAGLEQQYETQLRSASGISGIYRGRKGRAISGVVHEAHHADFGQDLVLSVDTRVQYALHDVLEQFFYDPQRGAKEVLAVVLDVQTSEILAMQSLPTANPNQLSARQPNLMRNRVVQNVYELGSIHKPIALLPALEMGKVSPNTHFRFPRNCVRFYGKRKVQDSARCTGKSMSVTNIIARSSNVGMTYVADLVPRKEYINFMKKLGFAQKSALNFPGERTGYLPFPKGDHEYATMYYGYSFNATLLQMANAYVMIANGGIKRPVSILKKETIEEGERVMSEKTARTARALLKAVVMTEEGTGKQARTPSYTTAGKTGTIRKVLVDPKDRKKAFYIKKYLSSFIGFAPADNPRIVVAVLVDEPQGKLYYGGSVGAPLFAEIVERTLPLLGVVSDKIDQNQSVRVMDMQAAEALPQSRNAKGKGQ